MNLLFLTLVSFESLQERNIYTDLMREFAKNGHKVYIISPVERRYNKGTQLIRDENTTILRLQIGNTQKTNVIEKGISTIMIEPAFKKAVMKYFSNVRFDLVLYSTPPITLTSTVEYVKKRDGARTYLLLKDIFPQNAVDLGMLKTSGPKSLVYKHFRRQEKKLYAISDKIGCMSQANVDYVLNHNPEIQPEKVEVCPNSIEVIDKSVDEETRNSIRKKYGIPVDKTVFVYGGNLGKPQGIPFFIECMKKCKYAEDAFFLTIGDGTEYKKLEDYVRQSNQKNLMLMRRLPKEDYDTMVGACDVGMIFLDYRFSIPNFPSRLLSYMQANLPILSCTDPNTDIGEVTENGGFGWRCDSNDAVNFANLVRTICSTDTKEMAENAFDYLKTEYSAERGYEIIMKGEE